MEKAVNHKILNLICCSFFNERNSKLALKDLLYYFCNEEAFYRVYNTFALNDKNYVIKMFHGARNQLYFLQMTNPFDKKDDWEIVSLQGPLHFLTKNNLLIKLFKLEKRTQYYAFELKLMNCLFEKLMTETAYYQEKSVEEIKNQFQKESLPNNPIFNGSGFQSWALITLFELEAVLRKNKKAKTDRLNFETYNFLNPYKLLEESKLLEKREKSNLYDYDQAIYQLGKLNAEMRDEFISLIRLKYALFLNDEIKSVLNEDEIKEIYQKFEGNKKSRYKICRDHAIKKTISKIEKQLSEVDKYLTIIKNNQSKIS